MKVLLVSTYPPMACGIGKYAQQHVQALQREGHHVDVLALEQGEGDFNENLLGGMRPLRLLRYAWAYDEIFIQYAPHFFFDPDSRINRLMTAVAFMLLTLLTRRSVSFVMHEVPYYVDRPKRGRLRHHIEAVSWRFARRIVFHSRREVKTFAWFYRFAPEDRRFEVWPQDKFLVRLCRKTRTEVRRMLQLDPSRVLFLCIGFIQPHKGFERPIHAFQEVEAPDIQLKIVGSVRINWDKAHHYAEHLHTLAAMDSRVEIIEGYLADDVFDAWIVAADYVIMPYHEIWSSAVAARAKLYDRPMIAADTGGLAEQMTEGSHLFRNDAELTAIIGKIAREHGRAPG